MSEPVTSNFLAQIIEKDIQNGVTAQVVTRFPPEPNGYLHIGHARAAYEAFHFAQRSGGQCLVQAFDTRDDAVDAEQKLARTKMRRGYT